MKKFVALLLVAVMLLSLVACSSKESTTTPAATSGNAGDTKTDAAETQKEVTNIVVFSRGGGGQTLEDEVIKALNEYSAEKIGVTITFEAVEAAEFTEALSRKIVAKEDLDVTFVASYTGFADLVAKGGLLDLTDMLNSDEFADLKAVMPSDIWDASAVGGRNYCVPNYKETAFAQTLVTPVELADTIKEKYGIDFNELKIESFRDLDLLEPYLEACKQEGIKYPAMTNEVDMYLGVLLKADTEYELIGTDTYSPYVMNKTTHEVSNVFENPDFAEYFETMARWKDLGYWSEENIPLDWNPRDQWTLGTWGVYPQNAIPDNAAQQTVSMGVPVYSISITQYSISQAGTLGSTWAIPAYSPKAEAALKWIQLIETDRAFADMMIYGIEGVNYTRDSEEVVTKIADSGWAMGRWKITSVETASITSADSPDLKQQYVDFNNAGTLAELASFTPDFTNIQTEMAAMKAVFTEVYHLYTLGFMDSDDLPDTMAKFKAAGDDTIIAELQSQIDAYFAN